MNYCPECGLEVSDDMAYCSSCGYNLDSEPSATGGQQQSQISESTSSSEVAGEKYERIGKIVAILTVIGSGVLIMDGISSQGVTASRMGSFHEIKWLIVVPPFITGLVSLPMAYGHWFRRMWSWRVTQLIYGIYSISAIISLLYSGPINPTGLTWLGLLITILIFYFLRAYEEGYSEK